MNQMSLWQQEKAELNGERIADTALPYAAQPANRIVQASLTELSVEELLAVLIGGKYGLADAEALARAVSGNLRFLYNASLSELSKFPGIGLAAARRLKAALEIGRRLELPNRERQITSPADAAHFFLQTEMAHSYQEELWAIVLDTKNRVIACTQVYRGNVNSSIIRPAEVYREAIRHNGTALLIAHNHPSSDPTPSPEDIDITRTLREAGEMLGIDLLDHLVIANANHWISINQLNPSLFRN